MPENNSTDPEIEVIVGDEIALMVRLDFEGNLKIHALIDPREVAETLRSIAEEYEAWLAAQS